MSSFKKNSKRGFTLLEVLIAFSILAVLLAAVIEARGNLIATASKTKLLGKMENRVFAELFKSERLGGGLEQIGFYEGNFEDEEDPDFLGARWEKSVETKVIFEIFEVKKVTYKITWDAGGQEGDFSYHIFLEPG